MSDESKQPDEQPPGTVVPTALLIVVMEALTELRSTDPALTNRIVQRLKNVDNVMTQNNPQSMQLVRLIASAFEEPSNG